MLSFEIERKNVWEENNSINIAKKEIHSIDLCNPIFNAT